MTGMYGTSAYQQINRTWGMRNTGSDRISSQNSPRTDQNGSLKDNAASDIKTKEQTPIERGSSLIPQKTEYGYTVGNVQLSDKAKAYYDKLKAKYHGMEFIAVSSDMKGQVQKNAAAYGNAGKMVVLIDEEKLERMAEDEAFRKKYEGIIAMSQTKLNDARNSLAGSGASVKNFGMSVDKDGKESFFATVGKSQDMQKKRIEKKAEQKKEQKVKDRKKAEKQAREERIKKSADKRNQKPDPDDRDRDAVRDIDDREYVTIEADSVSSLFTKIQDYSYSAAFGRVRTESERAVGGNIDFRG